MMDKQNSSEKKTKKAIAAALSFGAIAVALISTTGLYAANEVISQEQTVDFNAGTFKIQLTPGTLSSNVTKINPMAAGDTVNNYFNLKNISDVTIDKIEVTPKLSGELFSGQTPGNVSLMGCTSPFSEGKCTGQSIVLAKDSSDGKKLINFDVAAQQTVYLQVGTFLPLQAGNNYQDKSGNIGYTFLATQKEHSSSLPQPESR